MFIKRRGGGQGLCTVYCDDFLGCLGTGFKQGVYRIQGGGDRFSVYTLLWRFWTAEELVSA